MYLMRTVFIMAHIRMALPFLFLIHWNIALVLMLWRSGRKSLGHTDDYNRLMELSRGWEKLFDDSLKLVRPRVPNGEFIDNFNPLESWRGFQEGKCCTIYIFCSSTSISFD